MALLVLGGVCCDPTHGLKYNYGDGSYYVGSVDENGRPSGRGRYHNASGELEYEGQFLNGLRHGPGTWHGQDGSVFEGQFIYGRSEGPGLLVRNNGDRVTGDFLNRRPHGKISIVTAQDGEGSREQDQAEVTRIEGQFRHGMAHGHSTVWIGPRFRYEGAFRMGKPHGLVRIVDEDDEDEVIYEGKFINGRPSGGNNKRNQLPPSLQLKRLRV